MAELKDNKNTIIAVIAVVIVLAIIGWAAGWFGGQAPEQATAPAPSTEQPAAPAPATEPPATPAPGDSACHDNAVDPPPHRDSPAQGFALGGVDDFQKEQGFLHLQLWLATKAREVRTVTSFRI